MTFACSTEVLRKKQPCGCRACGKGSLGYTEQLRANINVPCCKAPDQ